MNGRRKSGIHTYTMDTICPKNKRKFCHLKQDGETGEYYAKQNKSGIERQRLKILIYIWKVKYISKK
jgi:hypothetical protein